MYHPALVFVAAAALPLVVRGYWLHILVIALYYALLSSSWCLLAGYAGQFSFAHVALAAAGAYTSAFVVIHGGLHPVLGIGAGALAAAGLGLLIGALCLRLRGPYLALFTIAFSEILRITLNAEYRITRGNFGLNVPPLFQTGSKAAYYYTALALLAASLLAMTLVLRSRFGLSFRAIREDEEAASSLGVNVVRTKIFAFVLSSLFAGLAGGFYGHYVQILTPNIVQLPQMGLVIAMVVIGGIESLAGAVAGAVILQAISEYLRDFGELRWVIFGAVIVLTLRCSQNGLIYPLYERLAARRRRDGRQGQAGERER